MEFVIVLGILSLVLQVISGATKPDAKVCEKRLLNCAQYDLIDAIEVNFQVQKAIDGKKASEKAKRKQRKAIIDCQSAKNCKDYAQLASDHSTCKLLDMELEKFEKALGVKLSDVYDKFIKFEIKGGELTTHLLSLLKNDKKLTYDKITTFMRKNKC